MIHVGFGTKNLTQGMEVAFSIREIKPLKFSIGNFLGKINNSTQVMTTLTILANQFDFLTTKLSEKM